MFFWTRSINNQGVIVQGRSVFYLFREDFHGGSVARGKLFKGELFKEKCPGGKNQRCNCPGRKFHAGQLSRGKLLKGDCSGAKVLGVIVLGEFHREQFPGEVVFQGGNIYRYMSGGQKSRRNCSKGVFLGGQLSGGSFPGGKRPNTVCSI